VEGGGQKAEDRRWRTEGGGQKAEGGAEGRSREGIEDRGRRTDDRACPPSVWRGRRTEGGGRRTEVRGQKTEIR
jgi:hypothetical protein